MSKTASWYILENYFIDGNFIWTEQNFFNSKINDYLDERLIYGRTKVNEQYVVGVNLDQLTQALTLQGLQATATHIKTSSNTDIDTFRALLRRIMTAAVNQYMIVNYNLNVISALNGGHFPTIGAYDQASDSVLILDTWAAFSPWTWVRVFDLYKSMNTKN